MDIHLSRMLTGAGLVTSWLYLRANLSDPLISYFFVAIVASSSVLLLGYQILDKKEGFKWN